MLRKTIRSVQKDVVETARSDSDSKSNIGFQIGGDSRESNSFFNVASLFGVLNPRNASYNDSEKSPKSPLDEFFLGSPRSTRQDACRRSWNSGKVGLSIVNTLNANDVRNESTRERILLSSGSRNITSEPKERDGPSNSDTDISSSDSTRVLSENFSFHRIHVRSPRHKGSSDVIFEIGGASEDSAPLNTMPYSVDACIMVAHHPQLIEISPNVINLCSPAVASKDGFVGPLSANDIELSEDYTCVTSHGTNPKTTHIYGDRILECHPSDEFSSDFVRKVREGMWMSGRVPASYPFMEFLSSCYACKKSLEIGKDIYIYRGEQAFCSVECRLKEILFDEATKETIKDSGEEEAFLGQSP
ncbi:hypothetical protein SAY86_002011 [Trapa natans]|uniref:FLZ-type domain-containing protein n=1 Tax=Trapa natans TaxID=22666 RepID=A0AAN7LEW2_TRANT|nr:hypothetical protein SAY86_002011 [Trapa natans]